MARPLSIAAASVQGSKDEHAPGPFQFHNFLKTELHAREPYNLSILSMNHTLFVCGDSLEERCGPLTQRSAGTLSGSGYGGVMGNGIQIASFPCQAYLKPAGSTVLDNIFAAGDPLKMALASLCSAFDAGSGAGSSSAKKASASVKPDEL